jgi:hypothetical protein
MEFGVPKGSHIGDDALFALPQCHRDCRLLNLVLSAVSFANVLLSP